ncbi:5079_t:CDS:2 [Diversispora eburnea]|uniref:5079_t:CDS:1 n=1 Tax=Diversispora eburnea TaxID=1213867 RepID=A0A9N8V4J4_9GLOM|nr:5079_t:CDS:2 [Diversispora eburnea]
MDIEEEEILDFEEAIDFNFSDNPDALNTELLDESMLDLDGTMDFNIDEPLEKLDKTAITPPPEDDPDELKLGLDDEFDPDFFKEFGSGDINENDGNLADDEFWKEFGLDSTQDIDILDNDKSDTNNTEKVEKSETDDIEVKSSQKDDIKKHGEVTVPKEEESKETKKSDSLSVSKSIPSTKSPEKEDGEIPTATTTSDNRQQQQKKQPTQSQPQSGPVQKSTQQQRSSNQRQTSQQQSNHTQQSNQNFRRSGIRRNNDWRPGNTGGEFFNGTFRTGFGPGMEGMPGMPMGQIPMGNPMIPNLPGPIIGPNIHVNPNFARLRPHAFSFTNPVTQFQPIGSGGPHMNMMPYQNQMDIPPFHPPMGPMVGGRSGNNNSFSRGGSTFNHHAISSLSKRKTPADGFEQKEPANKRNATNGKSVVQDNKDNNKSNASNTVDRTNKTANTASEKTLKSGIPTLATNKETSLSSIKTKSNSNLAASGSASNSKPTSAKSVLKQVQRTVKNNPIKSQTIVTKRELQSLASAVPGGFSLITLERVDNSAEITFKTLDGVNLEDQMSSSTFLKLC